MDKLLFNPSLWLSKMFSLNYFRKRESAPTNDFLLSNWATVVIKFVFKRTEFAFNIIIATILSVQTSLVCSSEGFAFDITLEWNRMLREEFSGFAFIDMELNAGTILFGGYKRIEWNCVELPVLPIYVWLGALNNARDGFSWEGVYGELLRNYETMDLDYNNDYIVLAGERAENVDNPNYIRRMFLVYFDHQGNYVQSLEFGPPPRERERFKAAFINKNGEVSLFSDIMTPFNGLWALNLFKVTPNAEIESVRSYDLLRGFAPGFLDPISKITKSRNGDFIISTTCHIIRRYNYDARGMGPTLIRLNPDGDLLWMDVRLDSARIREEQYRFSFGYMLTALEHSSGMIYATGKIEETYKNGRWTYPGIPLYKYTPDGILMWYRYYYDNYFTSSYFTHIVELRPDRLALFGHIAFRHDDERQQGLYAALIDSSGELLSEAFIRGEWIADRGQWQDVLVIDSVRVLALTQRYDRVVSIRFSLDPPASIEFDDISAPPAAFHLEPAYPNPFNSSAVVRFALPAASPVRLEVYDIAGRRAMTLQEGMLPAGRHSVQWDAAGMESGLYFIRLNTPSFQGSTKALLLK